MTTQDARPDAIALARAAAARAHSLEDLSPDRVFGLSEEQLRDARAGRAGADAPGHVSDAFAILDVAVALGRRRRSRSTAVARYEQRLESVDREIALARERLIGWLQTREACALELARRLREADTVAPATVLALVEEAERITRLPAVQSIRVRSRGPYPELEVRTHGLVFETDGSRRAAGPFTFHVMGGSADVLFDIPGGVPPHPHVMSSGRPCLGHAADAVCRALLDEEFELAIVLVSGFLLEVDPTNVVRDVECFPATGRVPGWYETAEHSEAPA